MDATLDDHSLHVLLYSGMILQGAVRLNFAREELDAEGIAQQLPPDKGDIEISRLVARPGLGYGKFLLMKAGSHCIRNRLGTGFVAMTQGKNLNLYSSFGMSLLNTILIPERHPDPYYIVGGTFPELARSVSSFMIGKLI